MPNMRSTSLGAPGSGSTAFVIGFSEVATSGSEAASRPGLTAEGILKLQLASRPRPTIFVSAISLDRDATSQIRSCAQLNSRFTATSQQKKFHENHYLISGICLPC